MTVKRSRGLSVHESWRHSFCHLIPASTVICWPSGPTLLCADISLVSSVISPPSPLVLVSVTGQHFLFTPSVILPQEQPLSPGESRTLSFISAAPLDLISI